jgi:hypothetical protein
VSGFYSWQGSLYPSGAPGVCYRAFIDVTTDQNESQGAGSALKCVPDRADRDPEQNHGWTICPIILDLDGDGFVTSGAEAPVSFFDTDYDGVREASGWLASASHDAFLWMDVNDNGSVDPGELFGSTMLMPNGVRAKNGFEVLKLYDRSEYGGNGDGVIDHHDQIWNALRLWIDANHDGLSDAHEISPIGKYQVTALELYDVPMHETDAAGNMMMLVSEYRRRIVGDGTKQIEVERQLADIAFKPATAP